MDESRYREAERQLWEEVGTRPSEHRVHLSRNDVDVRVQEVGSGPPVLFVHGGPGAAGSVWAPLAARLTDFRCLLLDRPGTGLSEPHRLEDAAAVRREAETLVVDALDALGVDRAHMVGSSHGSYVALLSAAAHPDRVDRSVHLGCPGFLEGMTLTGFDRVALLPGARHVFALFPASEKNLRTTLRQLGHGATLEAGTVSQATIDWCVAVQRDTDTMSNEFASMAGMGTFRGGFDPTLTVERSVLQDVQSPTYFLLGEHDPYGNDAVARAAQAMPSAEVEVMAGAGHLCWIDDLDRAVDVVRQHLLAKDRDPEVPA